MASPLRSAAVPLSSLADGVLVLVAETAASWNSTDCTRSGFVWCSIDKAKSVIFPSTSDGVNEWYEIVVICVIVALVTVCCLHRVLGIAVKTTIQSLDRKYLGVDIKIGTLHLSTLSLKLTITDTVVENPKGYETPHLLAFHKIKVNFSTLSLLNSCGRRLVVQHLELDDVEVNVEKKGISTSNVSEVLQQLQAHSEASSSGSDDSASDSSSDSELIGGGKPKKQRRMKVEVQKVVVNNVHVNLKAWKFGMTLKAADMNFDHLSEQMQGHELSFVMRLVLETILSSVVANIPSIASQYAMANAPWNWFGGKSPCSSPASNRSGSSSEGEDDSTGCRRCCK
mmetsp:Transcript_62048/g.177993  ORF Transcript_62048/g.177993 Transcript_62048/m.177993 type:complete len:340 (-) Transcript_62048:243-1262(-)